MYEIFIHIFNSQNCGVFDHLEMMSENSNNDKEESINFPIELDPFPFKSSSTENIDSVTHSFTKLCESSKLDESIEVKEKYCILSVQL